MTETPHDSTENSPNDQDDSTADRAGGTEPSGSRDSDGETVGPGSATDADRESPTEGSVETAADDGTESHDGRRDTTTGDGTGSTADEPGSGSNEPETTAPDERNATVVETHPTILPTVARAILAGTVLLVALVVVRSRVLFEDPSLVRVATVLIALLAVVAAIRYVVRAVVLLRTKYVVTDESVAREYRLLFSTRTREVPYGRIRSHEFEQGRVEYLLGYGSIVLNRGLGTLRLTDVSAPHEVHDAIRDELRE